EDLLAHEIRDRHLRRRDEVEISLPFDRKQILLELRQLAGSEQCLRLHEIRHIHFGVAVLPSVQIEHELTERAMQTRNSRAHDNEARARHTRNRLEVES